MWFLEMWLKIQLHWHTCQCALKTSWGRHAATYIFCQFLLINKCLAVGNVLKWYRPMHIEDFLFIYLFYFFHFFLYFAQAFTFNIVATDYCGSASNPLFAHRPIRTGSSSHKNNVLTVSHVYIFTIIRHILVTSTHWLWQWSFWS